MVVYGNRRRRIDLSRSLLTLLETGSDYPSRVEALVRFGEIESGILDVLNPASEEMSAAGRLTRRISMALGKWLLASATEDWRELVRHLLAMPIPREVEIATPEGYAFYAVYPESYALAAERFWREHHPEQAVVLGLRSIGTSLAGVVGAVLETHGSRVFSLTARPRGPYFDRHLCFSPRVEAELSARKEFWFLVVDEGPGLSGSSFSGAARELTRLGVPDTRIALFPSWETDGSHLLNARARCEWPGYRKYVTLFEETWPDFAALRDISAGRWRRESYPEPGDYPAAQPAHERRKYRDPATGLFLKFEGLGPYGQARLRRAESLSAAGLAPRPCKLDRGFVSFDDVRGHPLARGDVSEAFLSHLAKYLAHLRKHFSRPEPARFDELREMTAANAGEGLDAGALEPLSRLQHYQGLISDFPVVEGDGRMLPHEWIVTRAGWLKTDNLDHHDDHFFPGRQDIAWDLAGAGIELELDSHQASYVTERYMALSGDRNLVSRLAFYKVAYLAWRAGYCSMNAGVLDEAPDGLRFRNLAAGYFSRLRAALAELPAGGGR